MAPRGRQGHGVAVVRHVHEHEWPPTLPDPFADPLQPWLQKTAIGLQVRVANIADHRFGLFHGQNVNRHPRLFALGVPGAVGVRGRAEQGPAVQTDPGDALIPQTGPLGLAFLEEGRVPHFHRTAQRRRQSVGETPEILQVLGSECCR